MLKNIIIKLREMIQNVKKVKNVEQKPTTHHHNKEASLVSKTKTVHEGKPSIRRSEDK